MGYGSSLPVDPPPSERQRCSEFLVDPGKRSGPKGSSHMESPASPVPPVLFVILTVTKTIDFRRSGDLSAEVIETYSPFSSSSN
jgi:hypothetical protein